jgi:hypothetical protein
MVMSPLLNTISTNQSKDCKVSVVPNGEAADPGAKALQVGLDCQVDCLVPNPLVPLCTDGKAAFSSKLKTVATGCDGEGG